MEPVRLLLWVHILCMVGVMGALLSVQTCIPPELRNNASPSRCFARLANILLGVGVLAAIGYYLLVGGLAHGPHYNGVIGVKFVLMLGAAGLIGVSKRTDRGDTFRWIAFGLMLLASLFGTTLT